MINYLAVPGCRKIDVLELREPRNEYSVFNAVCRAFNHSPEIVLLNNSNQERKYVIVRQVSMTLFVLKLKLTQRRAGEFFGNKDHATAIWAIKTVQNLLDTDKYFREDVGHLFKDVVFPQRRRYIKRTKTISE